MKKILLAVPLVLAGCGGGLPSCDGSEVKSMVKDILIKEHWVGEGDACYEDNSHGAFVLFYKFAPDCYGVKTHDLKTELKNFVVKAEQRPSDGRSVSCSLSTEYRVTSSEKKLDYNPGKSRPIGISGDLKSLVAPFKSKDDLEATLLAVIAEAVGLEDASVLIKD